MRRIDSNFAALMAILAVTGTTLAQSQFTYQGKLEDAAGAADGNFDFAFRLFNSVSGGGQVGSTRIVSDWPVIDGLFTVALDFGTSPFDGAQRWLQVEVRPGTSGGAYTVLSPRQPLTAVPYALYAFGGPGGADGVWSSSGTNAHNTNTGNIGIGTSDPGATLHVAGTILSTGTNGGSFMTRNPNNDAASFSLGWLNDVARLRIGGNGAGASGGLDIQRVGDASLMRILHDGSVGIGTTAPGAKVHVVGDGAGTVMKLTNGGSSNTGLIVADVGGSGRAASFYGVTSGRLVQVQNDGSGPALIAFGDVGIGDGTPDGRLGIYKSESNNRPALDATNAGTGAAGVFSITNSSNNATALYASTNGNGVAVFGDHGSSGTGVYGTGTYGVYGYSDNARGVYGRSAALQGYGLFGQATGGAQSAGVYATSSIGWAGLFFGATVVDGNFFVTNGTKYFMIDNPINPSEEYLFHSCVESDEMKNVYDGVVVLDGNGSATVELPEWFDRVNGDFRYQLTCIGGFAPVYISAKLENNKFAIGGGTPNMEVSWQVTGVRIDPAALATDFQAVRAKPDVDKGTYLFPRGYGMPDSAKPEKIANPITSRNR